VDSLLVIAIPMTLIVIGIALNSFHIVHDQPEFSLEEDPADQLAAERHANYNFFFLQRARMLKRQKRVSRYAWLVFGVFITCSWWLYVDAVKATTESKQISAIQTVGVADSDKAVLSLTLSDGSTVQYLVKAPDSQFTRRALPNERPKETLESWKLASLGTAVNVGDAVVPLGITLRMSNEQGR
jgi:hypothetical protein